MFNKLLILIVVFAMCQASVAAEKIIFQCDTKPKGLIKIIRNNSIFKVNVKKSESEIFSFVKDYKKNTKKNFIEFNYSQGSELVAIGLVMGYFGRDGSTIHTIFSDEAMTHRVSYDVDNIPVLTCKKNDRYINKFKELDKEKKIPEFYFD